MNTAGGEPDGLVHAITPPAGTHMGNPTGIDTTHASNVSQWVAMHSCPFALGVPWIGCGKHDELRAIVDGCTRLSTFLPLPVKQPGTSRSTQMARSSACRLVRCDYGSRANIAPVPAGPRILYISTQEIAKLSALAMMVRFRHSGTEGRWWQGRWLRIAT